jgi:hypothetical protein
MENITRKIWNMEYIGDLRNAEGICRKSGEEGAAPITKEKHKNPKNIRIIGFKL